MAAKKSQFSDELISAYLDDELSSEQRKLVERVMSEDDGSRQLYEQLKSLHESVQRLPSDKLDAQFADRVLKKIRAVQGQSSMAASDAPGAVVVDHKTDRGFRRGVVWAALALAAAVLLIVLRPPEVTEVDSLARAPAEDLAAEAVDAAEDESLAEASPVLQAPATVDPKKVPGTVDPKTPDEIRQHRRSASLEREGSEGNRRDAGDAALRAHADQQSVSPQPQANETEAGTILGAARSIFADDDLASEDGRSENAEDAGAAGRLESVASPRRPPSSRSVRSTETRRRVVRADVTAEQLDKILSQIREQRLSVTGPQKLEYRAENEDVDAERSLGQALGDRNESTESFSRQGMAGESPNERRLWVAAKMSEVHRLLRDANVGVRSFDVEPTAKSTAKERKWHLAESTSLGRATVEATADLAATGQSALKGDLGEGESRGALVTEDKAGGQASAERSEPILLILRLIVPTPEDPDPASSNESD